MSNPTQTEAEKCVDLAKAMIARHVASGNMAITQNGYAYVLGATSRELELARAAAVKEVLEPLTGYDPGAFEGATRVLKSAGWHTMIMGDARLSLGLMAVDIIMSGLREVLAKHLPSVYGPKVAAAPQGAVAP